MTTRPEPPHHEDPENPGEPVQTDNRDRPFDPPQDISQDPDLDYSEVSL